MKFIVSSTELLHGLLSGLRVITKTNTPILDNFLFTLKEDILEVTSSDSETILKISIKVDKTDEEGSIAVPSKILTDSLKEFPEMPLEFETLEDNATLRINWENGSQQIPFFPAEYYPELPALSDMKITLNIPAEVLSTGIGLTIFATADETLRPMMNGILFDLSPESTSLVASDSHKLVCYTQNTIKSEVKSNFILHKKPAGILKSLLQKTEESVTVTYDGKNAYFEFDGTVLIGRLIEGTYPAYRTVIPANNPNKLYINRIPLLNAVRRVSICSNQATSSIKFSLSFNSLLISAQDIGYAISAHESIPCNYDGEPMDIGFKATFLIDILANFPYDDICFELADPARAALVISAGPKDPEQDTCSLLMPVRIAN